MIGSVCYAAKEYLLTFKVPEILTRNCPPVEDEKIFNLIKTHGLPDNTHVFESSMPGLAGTSGTQLSQPVIMFSSHLKELEEGAQKFILLHEIGHLKHEDILSRAVIMTISVCAFDVFSSLFSLRAFATLNILSSAMGFLSERRADSYAVKHAKDGELLSARRLFAAKAQADDEKWEKAISISDQVLALLGKFNYICIQGHPFAQTRQRSVESELARRGFVFSKFDSEDLKKIEHTKKCILGLNVKDDEKISSEN